VEDQRRNPICSGLAVEAKPMRTAITQRVLHWLHWVIFFMVPPTHRCLPQQWECCCANAFFCGVAMLWCPTFVHTCFTDYCLFH